MSGVVDRLLAQLPGLQGEPAAAPRGMHRQSSTPGSPIHYVSPPQEDLFGPWARVVLSLALGTTIAWWPYQRNCGFPLMGYLGAVFIIIVGGGWAAASAWRHRAALAHVLALVIMFYGMVMAGAELLPRTGYAVDRATWGCGEGDLKAESWRATGSAHSVRISI
jgi:hypothetical protein